MVGQSEVGSGRSDAVGDAEPGEIGQRLEVELAGPVDFAQPQAGGGEILAGVGGEDLVALREPGGEGLLEKGLRFFGLAHREGAETGGVDRPGGARGVAGPGEVRGRLAEDRRRVFGGRFFGGADAALPEGSEQRGGGTVFTAFTGDEFEPRQQPAVRLAGSGRVELEPAGAGRQKQRPAAVLAQRVAVVGAGKPGRTEPDLHRDSRLLEGQPARRRRRREFQAALLARREPQFLRLRRSHPRKQGEAHQQPDRNLVAREHPAMLPPGRR